jgi:hypothetical protein
MSGTDALTVQDLIDELRSYDGDTVVACGGDVIDTTEDRVVDISDPETPVLGGNRVCLDIFPEHMYVPVDDIGQLLDDHEPHELARMDINVEKLKEIRQEEY